jgi:hypothetical protein
MGLLRRILRKEQEVECSEQDFTTEFLSSSASPFRQNITTVVETYANGQERSRRTLVGNVVDGEIITYFPDGKVKYEERFVQGLLEGKRDEYDGEGGHIREYYRKGQLHGDRRECNSLWDTATSYVDGRKHGEEIKHMHYERLGWRLLERCSYVNGVLDGPFQTFWGNGQVRKTGQYKDGKRTGKLIERDSDGFVIRDQVYEDGKIVSGWINPDFFD